MRTKYMEQLSGLTGLPYFPDQGPYGRQPFVRSGNLIGVYDGFLAAVGLGRAANNKYSVMLLLRFKKLQDPAVLVQAVESSAAVAAVLGKSAGAVKVKRDFAVGTDYLLWPLTYSWSKPSPQKIADLLKALAQAMQAVTPKQESTCEECGARVGEITLLNNIPGYYCVACQQKTTQEQSAAAQSYAQKDSNFFAGLLYGVGGALVGSLAWGFAAFLLDRIFLIAAMVIGILIARLVFKGMGKVNLAGQVLIFVLTIASVFCGDAFYVLLLVMNRYHIAFSLNLLARVFAQMSKVEGQNVASIAFALIGAAWVLYKMRAPSFKASFEPLRSSSSMQSLTAAQGK